MYIGRSIVVVILLLFANVLFARSNELTELTRLLELQQYNQAFKVAERLFLDFAGEPSFDQLYAKAALETGHYDEATFALERILMVRPNHFPTQYLLALTYAKQKNYTAAKQILHALTPHIESVSLQQKVAKLRDRVEQLDQALDSYIRQQITFAFGHDGNVNSGTINDRIDVGGFTFLLTDESLEIADNYGRAKYQLNGRWHTNQYRSYTLHLDAATQAHQEASEYDRSTFNVHFSLDQLFGSWLLTIGPQFSFMSLDSNTYQQDVGVIANAQYSWDQDWYTGFSGYAYAINNEFDSLLDSKLYVFQLLTGVRRPQWLMQADLGRAWQPSNSAAGKHHGRDYWFVSLSGAYQFSETILLSSKLHYKDIQHRSAHPFFLAIREEKLFVAEFNLKHFFNKHWSVEIQGAYFDKESSIDIYQYDRFEGYLGVNYAF